MIFKDRPSPVGGANGLTQRARISDFARSKFDVEIFLSILLREFHYKVEFDACGFGEFPTGTGVSFQLGQVTDVGGKSGDNFNFSGASIGWDGDPEPFSGLIERNWGLIGELYILQAYLYLFLWPSSGWEKRLK